MGILDHQLMIGEESTYGVAVTPTRAYEFNSEGIEESFGRVESEALRTGQFVSRSDRWTPYFQGAAGSLQMDVLTKGFGVWLKHMLGGISSGTVGADGEYVHTATMADLFGKSLTVQVNRPFNPSGTNQAFTYRGGKVTEWELSNSVEGNLVLDVGMDFQQVATDTALAAAAYPTAMDNFTWAGGEILIGGVQTCVTEFSVSCNNNLDVDRRCIRQNTDKKEPVGGRREIAFSISADFESLDQRDRAAADSRAGALAAVVGRWVGPTAIGGTTYPEIEVTVPVGRFDEWSASVEGPEAITQELSGIGLFDGTNSPVTIAYTSADAAA